MTGRSDKLLATTTVALKPLSHALLTVNVPVNAARARPTASSTQKKPTATFSYGHGERDNNRVDIRESRSGAQGCMDFLGMRERPSEGG